MSKRKGKSSRAILKKDIQQRLARKFLDKGFFSVPLSSEEVDLNRAQILPLGRLKRNRGNKLDIVEIVFTRRRPQFGIYFGVVPEGGVTFPWGEHLTQDEASLTDLPSIYVLYPSPLVRNHFTLASLLGIERFGPGFFSRESERAITKAVDKAIKLSDEIFSWFDAGVVGRHMGKWSNQEILELLAKKRS